MFKFNLKRTQEIKKLQKIYFVSKALADTLEERANEIKQNILNDNKFYDEEGNRITNVSKDWQICEEQFNEYHQLRIKELRKAGIGHPKENEGVSVDCVASSYVVKIKHRIFDFVMSELPNNIAESLILGKFKMINGEFVFDKVIDLFLRLSV